MSLPRKPARRGNDRSKAQSEDADAKDRDALTFWRMALQIIRVIKGRNLRNGTTKKGSAVALPFVFLGIVVVQRSNDPLRGGNAGTSM
ncbi:hypothetical protein M2267_000605 [Ensifer sp. KUDG1]|uniref:hypothetical protein n=1 Tax=Ensifer sp. KUDG1 TaxID=3373919 RepID=UPI003D20A793